MKKLLFYTFLTLASMIAFLKAHEYANTFRYNDSFGGELLLLLIPVIVWYAIRNYKDYKETK